MGFFDLFRRKKEAPAPVVNNYYYADSKPKSYSTPPQPPRQPSRPAPQRSAPVNYGGRSYSPPPMGYPLSYYGGMPGYYDPLGMFIELEIMEAVFDGFDHDNNNYGGGFDNDGGQQQSYDNDSQGPDSQDTGYVDNSSGSVDTSSWGQQDAQPGFDNSPSYDSGSYDSGSYDSGPSYDSGSSSFDSGGGGW